MEKILQRIKYAIIGFLIIIITFGVKRLYDFARSPTTPKPCLFTFPSRTEDTTTLSVIAPSWLTQTGGFVNDASCLNRTPIYGMVKIYKEEDLKKSVEFAAKNNVSITPAGQKHSMGGQSFNKNGIVLDMRGLNKITIDQQNKIAHVQSGATWEELQRVVDPLGLSVKAMQSINIFTIGGTLSVNAHGIAHNPGSVASTVLSMRVMLADGTIVTTSPTKNPELFQHVLGGYGLFGIIIDAELQLVDNELYDWETNYVSYTNFPNYFKTNIQNNPEVGLFFARLSMNPFSYLTEVAVHSFTTTTSTEALPRIKPAQSAWIERLVFNLSKTGSTGRWIRWNLEKYIAKKLAPCVVSRNEALIDPHECLIARNQAMYDSMSYLKNGLADTDILQEYFVTPENFPRFVDGLKNIVQKNHANLLNVTIRYVHKDEITSLPYAKEDVFALVLYFNQHFNSKESENLRVTTQQLIDLVEKHQGTYYLPYQLYYSGEHLRKAYPEIDAFYSAKKEYDPNKIFTNTWFEKYFVQTTEID